MAFTTAQVRVIVEQALMTGDLSTGFVHALDPATTPYFVAPITPTVAGQLGALAQAMCVLQLTKQQQSAVVAVCAQNTTKPWSGLTNAGRVAVLQSVVAALPANSGADGGGGINQTSNLIAALSAVVP